MGIIKSNIIEETERKKMIQKLIQKIQKTNAPIVVGLDPTLKFVPGYIKQAAFAEYGENLEGSGEAICQYNKGLLDDV